MSTGTNDIEVHEGHGDGILVVVNFNNFVVFVGRSDPFRGVAVLRKASEEAEASTV